MFMLLLTFDSALFHTGCSISCERFSFVFFLDKLLFRIMNDRNKWTIFMWLYLQNISKEWNIYLYFSATNAIATIKLFFFFLKVAELYVLMKIGMWFEGIFSICLLFRYILREIPLSSYVLSNGAYLESFNKNFGKYELIEDPVIDEIMKLRPGPNEHRLNSVFDLIISFPILDSSSRLLCGQWNCSGTPIKCCYLSCVGDSKWFMLFLFKSALNVEKATNRSVYYSAVLICNNVRTHWNDKRSHLWRMYAVCFVVTFYYRILRRRLFKIAENVFYTVRGYEPFCVYCEA